MVNVTDIKGVGPSKAETLEENGYESVEDIAQADPDNLSEISGISDDRALEFMVAAGDLLDEEETEEDDENGESEFDLTPEEVSEELEDEKESVDEESVDEEENEVMEEEQDESEEPNSYTVSVDFETDLQYHTFHAAIMRYHERIYTSNQPQSDTMQKILDGIVGSGDVVYELTEEELNTLHTAVKQCRTNYQGDNRIDHMDALNPVEEQINNQRRDYLF